MARLTNAEKQARWRQRHLEELPRPGKYQPLSQGAWLRLLVRVATPSPGIRAPSEHTLDERWCMARARRSRSRAWGAVCGLVSRSADQAI